MHASLEQLGIEVSQAIALLNTAVAFAVALASAALTLCVLSRGKLREVLCSNDRSWACVSCLQCLVGSCLPNLLSLVAFVLVTVQLAVIVALTTVFGECSLSWTACARAQSSQMLPGSSPNVTSCSSCTVELGDSS